MGQHRGTWGWNSLLGHHAATTQASSVPPTVLLVDRHRDSRHHARRLLELAGFRVFTTTNGHDALLILRQSHLPVRVLIIDEDLPEMPGEELSERVKRDHPELPVLLLTRSATPQPGASGCEFLHKSFSQHALLRRVHELLHNHPNAT